MSRLKLFAAVLAGSASFASCAMAADMYDHASMKDAPMAAPVSADWTGFYIGGGIGGGFVTYDGASDGLIDADTTVLPPIGAFGFPVDSSESMVFGTAQIGYDRQIRSRIVVGVFADYDFSGNSGSNFDDTVTLTTGALGETLSVSGTAELDDSWTLGGRIGYLANPSVLLYGLVGWTHADLNMSGTFLGTGLGGVPVGFSTEDSLDAVTVGAGVETMLHPGISLKVEYRYTDLGGISVGSDLAGISGVGSVGFARADIDAEVHTARAVLTWRPGVNWHPDM